MRRNARTSRTSSTLIMLAVGLACGALVAVGAAGDHPPNTGMAEPLALVNAFDRFAAAGTPPNIVILSLSNLRGVSSEAVNAGGLVGGRSRDGRRGLPPVSQLLPPGGTFDLWLIHNQLGPGLTTLADSRGPPYASRNLHAGVGDGASGLRDAGACGLHQLLPGSGVRGQVGAKSGGRVRADRPHHVFHATPAASDPFRRGRSRSAGFDPTAARGCRFAKGTAEGRQLFLNETFDGDGRHAARVTSRPTISP